MVVYLYFLALQQTGSLSRVYPAYHPMMGIGSSPPLTLNWKNDDVKTSQRQPNLHTTYYVLHI